MTDKSEKRNSRRFTVDWEGIVKGADRTGIEFDEPCRLENLSSSGAYLSIAQPLQIGVRLELWIKLPIARDNWMKYPAEVVRVESHNARFGVALKFRAARPHFFKS
jgi:hypothetical protein